MKFWRELFSSVLIVLLVTAFVSVVLTASYYVWNTGLVGPPKFHAGACIRYDGGDVEAWHEIQTWRIEMVGKHNYLVRKTPESLYRDSTGTDMSFLTAVNYKEVECPKKT